MSQKQELTHEEKVDYIYNHILKEERSARIKRIIKIVFWLLVIGYFYIVIFVMLPKMLWNIIPWVDLTSLQDRFFWNDNNWGDSSSESLQENTSTFDRVREMLENNY